MLFRSEEIGYCKQEEHPGFRVFILRRFLERAWGWHYSLSNPGLFGNHSSGLGKGKRERAVNMKVGRG